MTESVSDKEFIEDSESNDEFEKKFEDSVIAFRESSRPSSSSSRPKTASRHRDDNESRSNLVTNNNYQVYMRLSKFISYQKISKQDLSSKLGDYFTAEKLKEAFLNFGLELNDGEIQFIFRDSGVAKTGLLRLSEFCSKIIEEEEMEEEEETSSLKNNTLTQTLLKEIEDLLLSKDNKVKNLGKIRKISAKSSEKGKNSFRTSSRSASKRQTSNLSFLKNTMTKNYLKENQMKSNQEKADLENTADLYRREYEFDCIQKMGEANEILQNLESNITYRAIRKDDMSLMCHIYKNDKFEEEISIHNFIRKWKKLKERKPKSKKSQTSQMTSKSTTSNNAKVNKAERQEEVKKLLLETRELTNSLKEQVKILEEKGIVKRVVEKEVMILLNSRM